MTRTASPARVPCPRCGHVDELPTCSEPLATAGRATYDAVVLILGRDGLVNVRAVAKERDVSVSTAHFQLRWLQRHGYVDWSPGRPNTIQVVGRPA